MQDDRLEILPPLYLIGKKIYCWKCESIMSAVAILAPNIENIDDEVGVLTDIVYLPNGVLDYIQKRVPTFKLKLSKTVGSKYYANTCPSCGMLSGDFHLHSEPGAPFFPTTEEEAKLLFMTEIPIKSKIDVDSSFHVGTGDLILKHAKQIP